MYNFSLLQLLRDSHFGSVWSGHIWLNLHMFRTYSFLHIHLSWLRNRFLQFILITPTSRGYERDASASSFIVWPSARLFGRARGTWVSWYRFVQLWYKVAEDRTLYPWAIEEMKMYMYKLVPSQENRRTRSSRPVFTPVLSGASWTWEEELGWRSTLGPVFSKTFLTSGSNSAGPHLGSLELIPTSLHGCICLGVCVLVFCSVLNTCDHSFS